MVLFSQNIPPSPSPTESKSLLYTSVSLFLFYMQGYYYHLSKFHIYALVYCIGLYLSGLCIFLIYEHRCVPSYIYNLFFFFVYFLIQIYSNVFLCFTFITCTFKAHFICCKKGDRPCTEHVALSNIRIVFFISLLTPLY